MVFTCGYLNENKINKIMTDSIIQFNYSGGDHLSTIYVRANTHKEVFIPILKNICFDIDQSERFKSGRLNWENMCLEIIKRVTEWVDRPDGVLLTTQTKDEDCNVIYKHIIQPIAKDYSNFSIETSKTLNITSSYPISQKNIFEGTLFDFVIELKNQESEEDY